MASTKFTSVLSFGLDVSRPDKLNPPSDKYDSPNLNVKIFKMRTEILLRTKIFFEDFRFFSSYGIVVKQSARHTPGFYIAFNNLWCQKARHLVITMTFGTCIGSLIDAMFETQGQVLKYGILLPL